MKIQDLIPVWNNIMFASENQYILKNISFKYKNPQAFTSFHTTTEPTAKTLNELYHFTNPKSI